MAEWKMTVDVSLIWDVYRDQDVYDEAVFSSYRDAVVSKMRNTHWYAQSADLQDLLEELEESDDIDSFNMVWSSIYDLADYDRVWINTIGGRANVWTSIS